MQTVQLQCGSCMNMMAISMEHLGAQVQCPHCGAVVQTPTRASMGGPPPGPDPVQSYTPPPPQYTPPPPAYTPPPQQPQYSAPPPYLQEPPAVQIVEQPESIFSEPEPSDDLFGDAPSPKVHMPEPANHGGYQPALGMAPTAVLEEPEEEEPAADLAGMRSRLLQERKSSNLAPTLLVFLIPYAIFTTLFLGYLLYIWPKLERFEYLPDPKKPAKQGAVELPVHDLAMPAHLRTALNKPLRVGDMEITPLKVDKSINGELTLVFKAKNLSANFTMMPADGSFFEEGRGIGNTAKSFTFLQTVNKSDRGKNVYGGHLEFFQGTEANPRPFDGNLSPGQECLVHLTTGSGPRTRDQVHNLLAENGRYLWRVQFRRGLVPIHGSEMSMTAVIGIEFDAKDVS